MIDARPRRHAGLVLACVLFLATSPPGRSADAPDRAAVLREALEAGLAVTDPLVRSGVLRDVGTALARAGQLEAAERAAGGIAYANWRCCVLNTVAGLRADAGDRAGALRTMEAIDDPQSEDLRSDSLGRIAAAQARAGDLDGALETLRRDRNPASRSTELGTVAAARAEAGDIAGAIRAAESWDDPAISYARDQAIARVAGVQAKRGEAAGAARTVAEHGGSAGGFAAIAAARREVGDADGAIAAARQTLARGGDWRAEAAARVILAELLVGRGEIDEAQRVAAGPWNVPKATWMTRHMPPNVTYERTACFRAIARGQAGRGEVAAAIETLEGIDSAYFHVEELAGLARTRAEAGDAAGAGRVLERARRVAEEGRVGFAYRTLAAAYVRSGQLERARDLFSRAMCAENIGSAENRRFVVLDQARAGDLERALRSAASIPEPGLRGQALAWVADDLARRGTAAEALDVAARIADPSVRATTLAHVSRALAIAGDRGRALAAGRKAAEGMEAASPEVARIIAHARAATPEGTPEALAWARHRAAPAARAAALLGVADGMAGRRLWVGSRSPYTVPGAW